MTDDDVIRIPLRARDGSVRAWAIVDREDEDLAGLTWSVQASRHGHTMYANRSGLNRPHQSMHRVILARIVGRDLARSEQTDHMDDDGLNNRRRNIRVATAKQNMANIASRHGSSSRYLGVGWNKNAGKWNTRCRIDGRNTHIGLFSDEEDAARAYDRAARESHGEFARLNFPDGGDA